MKAGTITISDRGIGMTADEIDKYINQLAFSGANDFLEKYKNDANAIIGQFRTWFLLLVHGIKEGRNTHAVVPRGAPRP